MEIPSAPTDFPANTAVPTPTKTSNNVPMNSAKYLFMRPPRERRGKRDDETEVCAEGALYPIEDGERRPPADTRFAPHRTGLRQRDAHRFGGHGDVEAGTCRPAPAQAFRQSSLRAAVGSRRESAAYRDLGAHVRTRRPP